MLAEDDAWNQRHKAKKLKVQIKMEILGASLKVKLFCRKLVTEKQALCPTPKPALIFQNEKPLGSFSSSKQN